MLQKLNKKTKKVNFNKKKYFLKVRELIEELKMGFYNIDPNALLAISNSALLDNTKHTDKTIKQLKTSLNTELNSSAIGLNTESINNFSIWGNKNSDYNLKPTTAAMEKNAPYFSADQLGTILTSTFLTPATAGNTDATDTLSGLNLGLNTYLNKMWMSIQKFDNDLTRLNLGVAIPGGNSSSGSFWGNNGKNPLTSSEKLDRKLKLIDEYCAKTGKDIDTNTIKQKYLMNPDDGIKYCDGIIKKFNPNTVKSIVDSLYKEDLKTKAENGKSISDSWVKSVQDATLNKPNINTFGVSSANILDVISSFISNKSVLNGSVKFKDIFADKNVYNQISQIIEQKANEMLETVSNEDTKKNIRIKLKALKSSTTTDKINAFYQLYDVLRNTESTQMDKNANENYGSEALNISLNDAQNQYASQKNKYEHRRVLNTKI